MQPKRAERAPAPSARGDTKPGPTIPAVPLFGTGNASWRERNAHVYGSDASLRWEVEKHRAELRDAGALGVFGGRLFAVEPIFSDMMLEFAREAIGHRAAERQRAAQAQADAAVAAREA